MIYKLSRRTERRAMAEYILCYDMIMRWKRGLELEINKKNRDEIIVTSVLT